MIHFLSKNKFYISLLFIIICSLVYYLYPLTKPKNIIGSLPGDTYYYAYETKWFCENYFKFNLKNNDLYAPNGVDMSLGYHMPALLTLGCLFYSKGPVAMFNFIEALQVILILLTSCLIAFEFIKNNSIRIFFVFIYSFSTFYLARIHGHTDILSTIWGTSLCFYFFYNIDLKNRNKAIFSFLALVFIFTSCWQNIPNLFLMVSVFLLKSIWKDWNSKMLVIKNLLIAGIISIPFFLLFSYPLFFSFMGQKQTKDFASNYIYNADALSYLVPLNNLIFKNFSNTLYDKISASRLGGYFELFNSIDYVVVAIFLFSIIYYKKGGFNKKLMLFLIFVYYLLSLGPRLTFAGKTIIELPYYKILAKYPPYSITRTPARLGIVTTFLITIFSLTNLDLIVRENKNLIIKVLLIVFCFYGVISTTYYSNNLKFLSFDFSRVFPWFGLDIIRKDVVESFVLNIPLASTGDDASQNFMQLYHQKKIISGLVSYAAQDSGIFKYIENNPILANMSCSTDRFPFTATNEDDIVSKPVKNVMFDEIEIANQLINSRIGYIIINKEKLKQSGCHRLNEYINLTLKNYSRFFDNIDENDYYVIFKLVKPSIKSKNLLYGFSKGWGDYNINDKSRWLTENKVFIDFINYDSGIYNLSFKVSKLVDFVQGIISVTVNDEKLLINKTYKDEDEINISVFLNSGLNRFEIDSENCEKPIDYSINSDSTCYYQRLSNFSLTKLN